MTVRALVPLKRLSAAKSRLADALPSDERRRLVLSMARHVVEVVRGCVDEVFLLTPEPVPELAGAPAILDTASGLNANVERALRRLDARDGDLLLVVLADLPLLQPTDMAAMIAACDEGVAIAPDHLGTGVNAIGLRQPLDLRFCFGPDSRRRFEAEAVRLGRAPVIVERPGLALDIDDGRALSLYAEQLAAAG